jgi:[ribosomal protein S5]-alanine N-acetyltransferase
MTDLMMPNGSTPMPALTTERLILRGLTLDDVSALHSVMHNAEVMRYFPTAPLPTPERIEKIIRLQLKHWQDHGFGWWAVEERSSGKFIGWAGLQYLPDTDENEVAYLLGQPFWGAGYATEAARASLGFAFGAVGLSAIVGIVHHENVPSQRVLEKIGMARIERKEYFGMDCFRYLIEGTNA